MKKQFICKMFWATLFFSFLYIYCMILYYSPRLVAFSLKWWSSYFLCGCSLSIVLYCRIRIKNIKGKMYLAKYLGIAYIETFFIMFLRHFLGGWL